MTETYHRPVMVKEVCETLQPRPGDVIVDCNTGTGGHSLALYEACEGKGCLVCFDLDAHVLSLAQDRFYSRSISPSSFTLVHANHSRLAQEMGTLGFARANRILMDLGASSLHLDNPTRGFSCQSDGPLDMRYDRESGGATAADIVNTWRESDLARLFRERGDERWARRIAKRLVERRAEKPIETTAELAWEIGGAIPRKAWPPKIHPATRVFLALRVEVNAEAESLETALDAALEILAPGGRVAVLSFQSNEDRVVKRRFRKACRDEIDELDPRGRVSKKAEFRDLTRRPLRPTEEEVEENPRSRSAKLRAVEKIETDS